MREKEKGIWRLSYSINWTILEANKILNKIKLKKYLFQIFKIFYKNIILFYTKMEGKKPDPRW